MGPILPSRPSAVTGIESIAHGPRPRQWQKLNECVKPHRHQVPIGLQPWSLQPFSAPLAAWCHKRERTGPTRFGRPRMAEGQAVHPTCGSTQNQRHERRTNNARSSRLASLRIVYKHSASLVYVSLCEETFRKSIPPKLRLCFCHLVIPSPLALLMLPHNGCLE